MHRRLAQQSTGVVFPCWARTKATQPPTRLSLICASSSVGCTGGAAACAGQYHHQKESYPLGQGPSKGPLVDQEANGVTCRMRASRSLTWKGFWSTYSPRPSSAGTCGFVV